MISLMPMVQTPNDDTDDGAAMNGGRRPTVVAAPVSTSPELSARPRRRTFTAKDKLRILADIDRATGTGATGAILRRDSRGDTDAFEVIEPKLKRLLEFRG